MNKFQINLDNLKIEVLLECILRGMRQCIHSMDIIAIVLYLWKLYQNRI
jgi:hypothetical protein